MIAENVLKDRWGIDGIDSDNDLINLGTSITSSCGIKEESEEVIPGDIPLDMPSIHG